MARQRPDLDISAPRSMQRAGKFTGLLLLLFSAALVYLAWTLVTKSPYYMAKSGGTTYGKVLDRSGDVLFDGTQSLSNYPAGQFADVGSLIGDTSGQMSNTIVARNIGELANYSFLYGNGGTTLLNTTLSHTANKTVWNAFGAKNGTAIAYNWKTGEVLICLSKPCIDIAQGYANLDSMPSGSLLCKAFYPTVPGSTQKVSTLIAAYEKCGIQKVNALEFSCSGSWVNASGGQINCHLSSGHGMQNLSEAFANSCNPYFAQLVQSEMLPLSALIETYTRMGYAVNGEEAEPLTMDGITIPAASTTLTDKNEFETQWGALGQGKTLVSPFQLMLWEGAIAHGSGSAIKPYLLSSKTDTDGNVTKLGGLKPTAQMFSAEAAAAVRDIMTENAANHYAWAFGSRRCGVKSGTAQVRTDGKEYENSFLTGFCLDDDCPVAFCVMIEERTSSDVSAPQIAGTLLNAAAAALAE